MRRFARGWAWAWRCASLFATLVWLPGLFACVDGPHPIEEGVVSARGLAQLAWAEQHLATPFAGYGPSDDLGAHAFDIILLSNLASGLMNVAVTEPSRGEALRPRIVEVAERATSRDVSPTGVEPERMDLGDHNLYASHLLLILGVEHHLGVTTHDALASRLARHLRERSLERGDFHARSYPRSARWPADQSVTLAALHLHDREHGTELSARPIAGWLRWLDANHTGALPFSAVSGVSYARIPRGCALSFMVTYMAVFAPEASARLYAAYREERAISVLGWRGFREWPRGHDGGSDVDAGPVLFGWGTAATGIGLGAARLHGDEAQVAGIQRIADTVGLPSAVGARYLLAPTVGQAMLFSGETATYWFDRPESRPTHPAEWPLGSAGLLVLVLALDAWLGRGLVRLARS